MKVRLRSRSRLFWRQWRPRVAYWTAAAGIGLVAVIFALASDAAQEHFHALATRWPALPLLLTPAGLIAIAWLTQRIAPDAAGSGIPQVLAALRNEGRALRGRLLSLRTALTKLLLTTLGIACGASVGREGPTVQIGAAIAHLVGRRAQQPDIQRSLILAGGAAGVAAAFNTPIGGIVFAFEELARSLEERASGTLLLLVIISAVVAMSLLGHRIYLGVVAVHLDSWDQWRAVLICGLVCGVAGGLFSRLLYAGTRRASELRRRWGWRVPLICGLVLALLGLLSTGMVSGSGYRETVVALEQPGELPLYYPVLKMLATMFSFFSGIPGGIFSPSLAIGAGFGSDLAPMMPFVPAAAVVLMAMAAYFAAATQSPLTAAVIVSEMTMDQRMILPLMASSLIAAGVARLVWRDSLYHALMRDLLADAAAAAKAATTAPAR